MVSVKLFAGTIILCVTFAIDAQAADASNTPSATTISAQIKLALKSKNDKAIREAAATLVGALNHAKTKPDVERLAKLAPALLRTLLDAADGENARSLANTAMAMREKYGKRADALAGDLINALGEVEFEAGDAQKALLRFELSRRYREEAYGLNHPLVAESLNNIAYVQQTLGDVKQARANHERSLQIRERTLPKYHKDIAESVNNLALLNGTMGNYALAETQFKRAMEMRRINPGIDSLDFAASLANLADLYISIGSYPSAEPLLRESLAVRNKKLGPRHLQIAENLNMLAFVHAAMGDNRLAEDEYRKALEVLASTVGTKHPETATVRNNLGLLMMRLGKFDAAKEHLNIALAMRRELFGDNHSRVARSLNNVAKVHLLQGELVAAASAIAEAQSIVESGSDPDAKWRVLDTASRIEDARGRRAAAIVFAKRAVNTLQSLRVELRTLDKDLQQSFVKEKGSVYRNLFEFLVAEGRLAEAQQVLVMLKQDEYFDFIQRGNNVDPRNAKAALSPTETASIARYEEVSAEIGAIANERATLRRKKNPDANDAARLMVIDEQLRIAKRTFDAVLGEIHQHFARASAERALEIGRMNLAELKAIQGTLEQLGDGTVTLHFVLLDDKVRILLTTAQLQLARESTINAQTLNRRIQSFREALQHPDRDAKFRSADLYRLLIAPVAKDLEQAGAKTLMLSLDGALRYIPFAALHDGEQYLIEKYRLTIFAEAARDKLKDKPVGEWKAAGLGMTQQVEGFSPLPSVLQELNAIVKTGKTPGGVLPGKISVDSAFSRKAVLGALEEGFPVLHIASHFVFNPGTELESFLLMGDKSRLSLKEMKDDDYDFRKVDLIALSACETAVGGGADNFGREIEGFAALVQKQGARSVIATLWQVADESTAELMALFYANRSVGHFSKAEALRQAQLTLLRGEVGSDEATSVTQRAAVTSILKTHANVKSGRYSHPFFWAPFVLTGNWL